MNALQRSLQLLAYTAAALVLIALWPHLHIAFCLAAALLAISALIAENRGHALLSPLPATLIAFAALLYWGLAFWRQQAILPLSHLLITLLVLRLTLSKKSRDYLQIFLLALFALATLSLLSLDMRFLLYLLLLLIILTSGLILLCCTQAPAAHWNRHRLAAFWRPLVALPSGSLLLLGAFFIILPRTETPLWSGLNPRPQARTGLAREVKPGAFSSVADSKGLVLRARGVQAPPKGWYWRARIFTVPDGATWQPPQTEIPREQLYAEAGHKPIEMLLEASDSPWLPLPDAARPQKASKQLHKGTGGTWRRRQPQKRQRLEVNYVPQAQRRLRHEKQLPYYQSTPQQVDQRLQQLAQRLQRQHSGIEGQLAALKRFFQQQQLQYTTENLPQSPQPLADFLFQHQRGYCEHFAASYGLLLRLMDIPCRLIGGYHGANYNELNGVYQVSRKRAHVWVEVYRRGKGWQRIDPTRWAVAGGDQLTPTGRLSWSRRLQAALSYAWHRSVVQYNWQDQLQMLQQTQHKLQQLPRATPSKTTLALVVGAVALILALARILYYYTTTTKQQRLIRRFLRWAKHRRGTAVPDSMTWQQLAGELQDPAAQAFVTRLQEHLYGNRPWTRADYRYLQQLLRQLPRQRAVSGRR